MSSTLSKDRTMHRFLAVFCFIALLVAGAPVMAQDEGEAAPHDADWVQQKVQTCQGCHGENGVSTAPTFPTIAGQYESYLLHALKGYRDGGRSNPVMAPQVADLTDAQLQALAHYYSKQETPLYTPELNR